MADEAKLHSSIRSTFEELVMRRVVRHCLGPFLLTSAGCRDCNFQVCLIDLLSVLLRCNSFAGIQKAVVDQMGSRPPVTMTFFWCKFGFGAAFLGPATELVVASCRIKFTFCLTSQSD